MNEIVINIDNEDDYINKYNSNNLSNDLSNYIYEECKGKPFNNKIGILIKSNFKLNEEKQKDIANKIHNNYKIDLEENLLIIKYSTIKKLLIFILGIIFLYMSYVLKINFVLSETVLIIGWVAIWEAAYAWLFESDKIKIRIKRLKKLSTCDIKFEEISKK